MMDDGPCLCVCVYMCVCVSVCGVCVCVCVCVCVQESHGFTTNPRSHGLGSELKDFGYGGSQQIST